MFPNMNSEPHGLSLPSRRTGECATAGGITRSRGEKAARVGHAADNGSDRTAATIGAHVSVTRGSTLPASILEIVEALQFASLAIAPDVMPRALRAASSVPGSSGSKGSAKMFMCKL